MESRRILDLIGCALLCTLSLRAQTESPDALIERAVAAAQQQRWEDARAVLLVGLRAYPNDPRFATELGGVAFREANAGEAAAWLRRALRLKPDDSYTADFLATIYYLQGNTEAAVQYWNRVGKPVIRQVIPGTSLRIDPVLLDRAFAFGSGEQLSLRALRTTQARLHGLDVFPNAALRLEAQEDGRFDAKLIASERTGFGQGVLGAALTTLRGIGYQALRPEYANIGGSATNVDALIRWDPEKQRYAANLAGPLRGNPRYRYAFGFDLRDENWTLRRGAQPAFGSLDLQRRAVAATVAGIGDRIWMLGGEFSHRSVASLNGVIALPQGYQAKLSAQFTQPLARRPEYRFESSFRASSDTARIWSAPSRVFEKVQAGVSARWNPKMSGNDYQTIVSARAGQIVGTAPFDELFILGLERDNDIPLRAHIGTRDGRKGSAPIGRRYFVVNAEVDKLIYSAGFWSIALSPFFDTGKTDASAGLGPRTWLFDTGVQAKLRVLGVGFTFVYGKDLRTGANTFYALDRAR